MSKDFYIKKLEAHEFRIPPTPIEPPKNWEPPKNFPFCCEFHKNVVDRSIEFVEDCKKDKYIFKTNPDLTYLVKKVVYQLSYCEEIISQSKDDEDWFLAITDYFEYSILSFGHPGYGNNIFVSFLKFYILKTDSKINIKKRKKLVEWIDNKIKPKVIEKGADLNVLNHIYLKWIETFPFDLPYFQKCKEFLSNKKPFVAEILNTNRYTGYTTFKVHTEESMIQYVFGLTKTILSAINSVDLVRKGKITDLYNRQFDLICKERELKSNALLKSYNQKERKYITTIQTWLKDEIDFFNKLKKLEKDNSEKPTDAFSAFDLNPTVPKPEAFMEKDNQKIEEFIDSWVNLSVDLNTWLQYKNIDFQSHIKKLELSESEQDKIYNLQYELFKAAVKNIVDGLIYKVERLSDENKKTKLIALHKTILYDFFHHGNLSKGTITNLSSIRSIRSDDSYLTMVLNAYSEVTQMIFDSSNCLLSVPGSFIEHPFFYASVMYDYLNFLEIEIKKSKKTELKKPINSLTFNLINKSNHKWIKDLLLQLNLKFEIFEELKHTELMYKILISNNIYEEDGIIKLNCKTNQFKYIIELFMPYFRKLNPSNIERSNKFKSSDNNFITKSNLYNSKTNSLRYKDEILNVFSEFAPKK